MKNFLFNIVLTYVKSFSTKIALNVGQSLWDGLWEVMFEAIEEAENEWNEGNKGEVKKNWVLDKISNYIEDNTDMNWFKRRAINFVSSRAIDSIIDTLNDELGTDWIDHADNVKEQIEEKIPFIN